MKGKKTILNELNIAIDNMDMENINLSLQALSSIEKKSIQPEDALVFSQRIQTLNKESYNMKYTKKTVRIALIAAAIMLMGVSAYAAAALNGFSFASDDTFITMRTTENMTQQQAKNLVEYDSNASFPENTTGNDATKEFPMLTFDSIEQAASEMDMQLVVPSTISNMLFRDASGQRMDFGNGYENRTVWLSYTDEEDRMLEVTTSREIIPPGSTITSYTEHDIVKDSVDTYKCKSGLEFTTLKESDPDGNETAYIATIMIGEYDYALVFSGFEKSDIYPIIDSADLSVYQK